MREARHGNGVCALFASGQGDVEDSSCDGGVFKEELVEVAHAKEQDSVLGALLFGVNILLKHRR